MNPAFSRYAAASRETASPERLMVLLFQAALRHMRTGIAALDAGRASESATSLCKASDIVLELHRALDPTKAPELCEDLGAVYRFVALRLNDAVLRRDAKLAREAERAFSPIADAFETAVERVAAEGRAAR
jgi:flagellar protein FliS